MDWNVHKKGRYGMRYIYRRKIMLLLLIAVSLISVRLLTGCGEGLSILTESESGSDVISDEPDSPDNPPVDPPDDPPVDPWQDYSYRRSVTVANSGSSTQTDYQVNIILNSSNFSFSKADTGGNDIRFYYSGTSIPYWIESWDYGAQSASVWVKIPSLPAGDTVIYLYYGNSEAAAASDFDNTFTKNSGFSGLVAQWHMDEGSGSSIDDSSSNSNDGTVTGATWAGADGGRWYTSTTAGFSTGDSLSFDGTDDYVTVADSASLDVSNITIAAWIKTADDVTTTQFIIAKWDETLGNERSYAVSISGSQFYFWTSPDGDSISQHSLIRGTVAVNTWYHLAVTSDGTNKSMYINGSELTPAVLWSNTIHAGTSNATLGRRVHATTQNYFDGIIDEVSIYNRALSADEVKALSQRRKYSADIDITPDVGSEEPVP